MCGSTPRHPRQTHHLPADQELLPLSAPGRGEDLPLCAGFLHAKTWLCDDRVAAVGTVNLDYRSLYLHFECSALLYGGKVLEDIRADFAAIEAECEPVGLEDCRTGFLGTLHSAILRLLAPLC